MNSCDGDIVSSDLSKPTELDELKFCKALCKFVTEVRKHKSQEYPPNTFKEIICIQMFLHTKRVMMRL